MSKYEEKKFYISGTKKQAIYFNEIDYALIKWNKEYICCWKPYIEKDIDGIYITSWSQGHYFNNFNEAKDYLSEKFIKELDDCFCKIKIFNEGAEKLLEIKEREIF